MTAALARANDAIDAPEGSAEWLAHWSSLLEQEPAEDRVAWALERYGDRIVLASSFGAQAAVSLHMVTRQRPDIPVVLIDTGYLFPETYQFIDEMTDRLGLNLTVYRPALSPAWQETRYGKLWEQGVEGLNKYNEINKIEPMRRALAELDADAWIAGLRRQQSTSRAERTVLEMQNDRIKVHPLIDWTDRDVFQYLKRFDLPYHPLWHEGYVSIGDRQLTRPLTADMTEEETRFFGLKRECGLHEDV